MWTKMNAMMLGTRYCLLFSLTLALSVSLCVHKWILESRKIWIGTPQLKFYTTIYILWLDKAALWQPYYHTSFLFYHIHMPHCSYYRHICIKHTVLWFMLYFWQTSTKTRMWNIFPIFCHCVAQNQIWED